MARDIKLNSSAWCDMVFEGRNLEYGAYELRKTSSKRHLLAFSTSILFVSALIAIPTFLKAVKPEKLDLGSNETTVTISDLEKPKMPEENIIRQEIAPPTPPLKATITYTPPAIVEDSRVDETREMDPITELTKNPKLQISTVTNLDGSTDAGAIDPDKLTEHGKITQTVEPEKPVSIVEQMPQFPGGDAELMRFISGNLKYPTIAAESMIQGRVVIRFIVAKDGNVSNIEILRSLDPSCDKEAVRVVKSMPKWIPGMQNGRNVPVYYTLPILFKLQ